MKIISLVGQKGGGGKTTIAINLAVEAVANGQKVALLDLDPQASAADWGDGREEGSAPSVSSVQHSRLVKVLAAAKKTGSTLAIIDTAGKLDEAAITAIDAADLCLVPLRPFLPDMNTLKGARKLLHAASRKPPAFIVINTAPPQDQAITNDAIAAAENFGFDVCPVVIRQWRVVTNAWLYSQGVSEYDPESKAAEDFAALYAFTMNPKK